MNARLGEVAGGGTQLAAPGVSFARLALLSVAVMACWSALFAGTFRYSFFWDDLHFIRPYSPAELAGTFHGWNDPDHIETPALRPLATLLFAFQGGVLGEDMLRQRLFMAALMTALLLAIGSLLREVGLSFRSIAIAVVLLASSRVFACLAFWLTIGPAALSYVFMAFTAVAYLRFVERSRGRWLVAALAGALLAAGTREEIYSFPAVLPLLWWSSSRTRAHRREALLGAAAVAAVVVLHLALRRVFVPEASTVQVSPQAFQGLLQSFAASWLPGGLEVATPLERLARAVWVAFVLGVLAVAARGAGRAARTRALGACAAGVLLCAPALGQVRTFGICLPTAAFAAVLAAASSAVLARLTASARERPVRRWTTIAAFALGLGCGVGSGLARSKQVADALHDNCASKVMRDGLMLFDLCERPPTIPPARRSAGLARLSALGVRSAQDVRRLHSAIVLQPAQFLANRRSRRALFLPLHDFLSF